MLGTAQRRYLEQEGRVFFRVARSKSAHGPIVDKLPLIDTQLAYHLAPESSENTILFLSYLSMATRQGNMCVEINESTLTPDPKAVLMKAIDSDNEKTPTELDFETIKKQIIDGAQHLPELPNTIYIDGNTYYFKRYWTNMQQFSSACRQLLDAIPKILPENQPIHNMEPEQEHAIRNAMKNTLSIICGGPGTGKTFTAGRLIRYYWCGLDAEKQNRCTIAVAAPTGKAAANLQRSLTLATADLEGFPVIQAQTLHALLGIRRSEPKELTYDLVLIDESSMIDAALMARLFRAVKPGSRLILLGDPYQLPPVEVGAPFSQLINSLGAAHVTTLSRCLRAELKTIVDLATLIKHGDSSAVLRMLTSTHEGIGYEKEFPIEKIAAKYPTTLPVDNEKQILESFNNFRLLTPLRKGPLGVDHLNMQIFQKIRQRWKKDTPLIIPIMITANDYKRGLFNGETGVIIKNSGDSAGYHQGDYALFPDAENSIRRLPALLLPRFELAYCLSVHKSQGSEFKDVVLMLPKEAEIFGREVFYTGVTRAKRSITVTGSEGTIINTIITANNRNVGKLF